MVPNFLLIHYLSTLITLWFIYVCFLWYVMRYKWVGSELGLGGRPMHASQQKEEKELRQVSIEYYIHNKRISIIADGHGNWRRKSEEGMQRRYEIRKGRGNNENRKSRGVRIHRREGKGARWKMRYVKKRTRKLKKVNPVSWESESST